MLPSPIKTSQTLILLAVLMFALAACSSDKASGEEGDFVLNMYVGAEEVGGQSVAFDELIAREDRPIMLNFWAGNCPPCEAEMPALQAAWEQFGDQVLFVGVDIGPFVGLGSTGQAKDLIERLGITYPTGNTGNRTVVTDWRVSTGRNSPVGDDRAVSGVPGGICDSKPLDQVFCLAGASEANERTDIDADE